MANAFNTTVSNIVGNQTGQYPDGEVAAFPVAITAAGSTQATAAALTGASATITGTASTGVILPLPTQGQSYFAYNAAAVAIAFYPPLGGTINGGTVNAALSTPSKKAVSFRALDGLGNYAAFISA